MGVWLLLIDYIIPLISKSDGGTDFFNFNGDGWTELL